MLARGCTSLAVTAPSKLHHTPRALAQPLRQASVCRASAPLLSPPRRLSSASLLLQPLRLRRRGCSKAPRAAGRNEVVQSEQLETSAREAVEEAIVRLGNRVTAGDVAASAGLSVDTAAAALNAIASDAAGCLEVSGAGELVYVLPDDFQAELRRKSWKLRLEPALKKLKLAGGWLVRVSFGTALIASVVAVWVAIASIQSSGRSSDNDRRGNGGYYIGRSFFNISDLFWYWDPFYYSRARERQVRGEEMSFLESIFSFVFGDGDPNEGFDSARWSQLGRLISSRGGVVTAEEMAPYLIPAGSKADDPLPGDESYVLPALVRFGGEPEVDDQGQILYRFPSFQVTAAQTRLSSQGRGEPAIVLEEQEKFTNASNGQAIATVFLGILNLVGVGYLSSLVQSPQAAALQLSSSSVSIILGSLPFLQVYAASFFVIPLARCILLAIRNAGIDKRNQTRVDAAQTVSSPTPALRKKLSSARAQAERKVLRRTDSIFMSDKDVSDQAFDPVAEEFDRKLRGL